VKVKVGALHPEDRAGPQCQ